ncbi:hypothetical protein [Thauera sp. SDU_THAU2]|uniref:hypothetical protein n=1 Tax=Thauera sp. SDU_THAU2 TaxID=3136633 RepID=UPI00311DB357
MKKILLGMVMATMAASVMAQTTDREEFDMSSGDSAKTADSASSVATNWTYTVADDRGDRNFVKQDFDFSLSANVILAAAEDSVDGRWMTVGAVSVLGRNVYVGHSDGGSVAPCGDPLPAADAKAAGAMVDALDARFTPDTENGCTPP